MTTDPVRLAAVDRMLPVAVGAREALDRLAGLAAVVLDAPVAVVTLLGAQQHLVGSVGMDEPVASSRLASVQAGFCPAVLQAGRPLFVEDATQDTPDAQDNPDAQDTPDAPDATQDVGHPEYAELGLRAYAGAPLRDADGLLIGTLCVADTRPHRWPRADRDALVALASSTVCELAAHQDTAEQAVDAERRDAQAREAVAAEQAARQAAEAAAARLRALVAGLNAIVWEADARSWECSFVSDRAEELLGYPTHQWLGSSAFWQSVIHPADRDEVARTCRENTDAGRDHDLTYRIIAADGRLVWLHDVVHVVCSPDGTPRELQGVMIDITAQKRREQAAALLAEAGRLLAEIGCVEDKLSAVGELAAGKVCDVATFWLRGDDGRYRPVAAAPAASATGVLTLAPVAVPDELDGAYRAGRAFVVPHVSEEMLRAATRDDAHYRAAVALGTHSALVVPLVADGRIVGSLTLITTDPDRRYDDADLALAEDLGQRVAAMVAAERVAGRQRQLQRSTAALAAADSVAQAAQALVAGVGDAFGASALSVYTVEPERGELHLVHAVGYHPDVLDEFAAIRLDDPAPIAVCARTGDSVWLRDRGDWRARYPQFAAHVESTGNHAGVALPLRVEGRVIGVLGASFPTSREFAADERDFALTLVGQAAQAFERAAAADERRSITQTLQRSLLPPALPDLPRLALTARYLPGSDGAEAGGDWYDVLDLGPDHVALTVGDVVGHGAPAAAVMGQLRSALASSLLQGQPPAQALHNLNRFAARVDGAQVSTVALMILDTGTGELRWASAGHPPPLVIDPRGQPRYLQGGRGPCLGVSDRLPFREGRTEIAPGSCVLLCSDGLIERRGEVLDEGLDRLAGLARELCSAPPEQFADQLLARMLAGCGQVDDVALVIARLLPPPLHLTVPAVAAELPPLRGEVRSWATATGLSGIGVSDLVYCVDEAASNCIEHAYPPGQRDSFEVALSPTPTGGVTASVSDNGRWRPPPADNGYRGRGLELIDKLAEQLDVRPGTTGTTVRFQLAPVAGAAGRPPSTPPWHREATATHDAARRP